jgi:hypothetical protein
MNKNVASSAIRFALALLFMFLILCGSAFAQNGTVSGTVQDATGAVIPGATVIVTNKATGTETKVTSLSDGKFLASDLIPGTYDIAVEAQGFKRYVSSGIEVHVSDRLTYTIPLQVGESKDTVTVTDEAPPLRTEDAQTGEVINNNFISNMPQLNRNPFALLGLSGDVAGKIDVTSGNTAGQNTIQLNGGRTSSVDYYVDGAVVNSGQANALTGQTPSMDAVAEFKVVTSGISAEFGRISGGYITLVTKSGTNAYHGSLYEYMFNDMFNANAWDQNSLGAKKAHFRQNNFGFTFGGPVSIPKLYSGKNKTFFFIDNEYLKKNSSGTITVNSVPNAAERSGDLSGTTYAGKQYVAYDPNGPQVYNSAQGLYERTGLLGGDGKHVPLSLISPVSTAILKLIPTSNRPSLAGYSSYNNYGFGSGSNLYNFRIGVRLDHNISDKNRVSISFRRYDTNLASTPTMDTPLYVSNVTQSNGGVSASVNYTWIAKPTLIVDFKNSVNFNPTLIGASHDSSFSNSFLPSIYQQYLGTNDVPNIGVTFMSGTAYGQRAAQNILNSTTYNFGSTATKIMAKHTLKFGFEHRRYYDNFINSASSNVMNFMVDPLYQFQGDWGLGLVNGRVLGLESFLLGINDQNNIAKPTTRAMSTPYWGAFVQDDWKLTSKITVNLGLRWDDERATTERGDKIFFWDPSHPSLFSVNSGYNFASAVSAAGLNPANVPVPAWSTSGKFDNGAVLVAGTPDFSGRSPQSLNNHQFAPRIGVAYQFDSKTVIRAYGGKMYLATTGNPSSYATANSNIALSDQAFAGWHASTDGGRTYISTWSNPFPLASMFSSFTKDTKLVNQESSLDPGASAVSATLRMPREYDWSLDVQRQLPYKFVGEVSYTGNRGLGLLATDTISHFPANLLVPQYGSLWNASVLSPNAGQTLETTITGTKQQLGLLEYNYPFYGRVQVSGINEGRSSYNALNVRLERRFGQGVSGLLNYTYGRLMDDVGGPDGQGGKTVQSVDSFRKAWGLSPLDRTNRLNLAFTGEIPIGKGRMFLKNPHGVAGKALDYVVGGWQAAGNWSYTGGNPIILTGSTSSNINNGIKINQTWGSYCGSNHDLISPSFTGNASILYSPVTPIPSLAATCTASSVPRFFDTSKTVQAQAWVSGNLVPTDGRYRNPPLLQMDLSIMKNIVVREGWYFQIRGEAQNAFNYHGYGNVNASIGTPNYGLITSAGNATPRQIQLSARFNF